MKQILIAGLFILIGFNSYSQYQTQKGRWTITHTLLSGGPFWYNSKNYDDGVLESSSKGKETYIAGGFSGPNWGGVEFNHKKEPTPKPDYRVTNDLSFSIQPQAGYFIKDNLMIGAAFIAGFDIYKAKEEADIDRDKDWFIGAGPIARYYIGNNKKYRAFVGLESRAYFLKGRAKGEDIVNNKLEEYNNNETEFGIRVKPYAGYGLFLGKHWTADMHLGLMYERVDHKETYRSYIDKVLRAGYPYNDRYVNVSKMLSLNVGIAYTF